MCDYSLDDLNSTPGKPGDILKTHDFGGTRGFCNASDLASGPLATPVCLLPGTELSFEKDVLVRSTERFFSIVSGTLRAIGLAPKGVRVVTFGKFQEKLPGIHHDAIQFPDGTIVLLNELVPNQRATVLSLPAEPRISENSGEEPLRQLVAA